MELAVALVADDLTGALDAAAPFAARGLRVRVCRGTDSLPVPREPAAGLPPDEDTWLRPAAVGSSGAVLAVDTSTRHLAPDAARAVVAAAGRRLRTWSPRVVFKKIDSTLRGPVTDEVMAAMEVFRRRAALVCPAFPAAGRVVRGGEVFVYGARLRDTEYTRDLRTPAPVESLHSLFARVGEIRGIRPGETLSPRPGQGVAIADAETDSDLGDLAALVAAHAKELLAVGSDGLAAGLAGLLGRPEPTVRLAGGRARPLLFALGSRAGTTAEQAERLRRERPDIPVVDAPAGVFDAGAVIRAASTNRVVVVRVPASPLGDPGAVVRTFAAGLRSVVEGLGGPGRLAALVATGGDTVEAILDAYEIPALDVLGEFRPGIPVSRSASPGAELTLVSKAGGFGTADLFAEIAAEASCP